MLDLHLIGRRIKELRLSRGLTQSEFAKILSVSFQAVSSWERGIAPPDIENLINIASHFGVLVDTLLAPQSESLYLGIDGGGTKTEFAVVSDSGYVLKRVVKSGCNPNDIGLLGTETLLNDTIKEILIEFPSVKSIFCGLSGISTGNYKDKLQASLKALYPKVAIKVAGDIFNLFALNDKADMAIISGTGSVVFAKSKDGYQRIGGWGHLFDKAGSAYDIGRDAIRQALREEDAGDTPSYISKLIYKKLNTSAVWNKIGSLYDGGKPYIAEFASLVFDAYTQGDENAVKIIDNSARALSDLLKTAKERYHAGDIAIASGGLFQHYPDIMRKHISKYTSIKLEISDIAPIYGACKNACDIADVKISESFYESFKKSIGEKEHEHS